MDPKDSVAYQYLGAIYGKAAEYDKAILSFDKAIEIDPKLSDAIIDRGVAYEKKGDLDRAASDYRAAMELGHDRARGYLDQLNALKFANSPNACASLQDDAAINACEVLIQQNPSDTDAYKQRSTLSTQR